jgi:hypothetical protein
MPRSMRHGAIITLAALIGSGSAQAVITPVMVPVAEMRNPALHEAVTGPIVIYNGSKIASFGSGAAISHPKVLLTCAHVSVRNGQWIPAGSMRFTARYHAAATPATGVFMRGYYRYDNYSAAVRSRGMASHEAYNWDMIAGFAYVNFAGGLAAGHWSTGADIVLKNYNYWKKTTGYPVEKTKNFYQYRMPSFLGSFQQTYGAHFTINGVTSYGGNSGGPVWGWDPNQRNWFAAGVFVSSDRATMMGVRVLDANGTALLTAARRAVGG